MSHRPAPRKLLTALLIAAVAAAPWVMLPARTAAAQDLGPLDKPVSPELVKRLEKISRAGLNETPHFQSAPLKTVQDDQAGTDGAPLVLYVGADYCPFCAALRWPLAIALMRFGDLRGLLYMRSSGRDVFPNTATFSFSKTQLSSGLLRFQTVEIEDRDGKPLQKPTDAQLKTFMRFDIQPYTQYPGAIPFLDLGGRYLAIGSPFSPDSLQGLDWQQIVQQLERGGNPAWQDIMGEADILTAAMCTLTRQQPNGVCMAPAVKAAAGHLPHE
ncbi:MAG TPA: DUF929 family protein [Gammaproteobacteria bacterium]|nr:DUF929 family protein [Gammaproteobacteria bacterium]